LNISQNISKFIGTGQRPATGPEASFDFCFNYFQSFRRKNDIESIASSKNIDQPEREPEPQQAPAQPKIPDFISPIIGYRVLQWTLPGSSL